jgi:hypothetical protein
MRLNKSGSPQPTDHGPRTTTTLLHRRAALSAYGYPRGAGFICGGKKINENTGRRRGPSLSLLWSTNSSSGSVPLAPNTGLEIIKRIEERAYRIAVSRQHQIILPAVEWYNSEAEVGLLAPRLQRSDSKGDR